MFKLILTDGRENAELLFTVRDTAIAKKWYAELCKNYPIYENDRFTNWGNNNIVSKLKEQIKIICKYDNTIQASLSDDPSQDELNVLHKYFEDLRGEVIKGTVWYNTAPKKVQTALMRFNILIHQLEANTRTKNHPTIVVTFKDRPRYELNDDDIKHFTFRWTKGTVYINYCHVGKTVLDIFKDKDKIANAVRPQTHYSADFMIKFGPTIPYTVYLLKKAWIKIWLPFQRFKFTQPNIGMVPVADLVGDFNIKEMQKFNKVKKVSCIE